MTDAQIIYTFFALAVVAAVFALTESKTRGSKAVIVGLLLFLAAVFIYWITR